MEHKNIVISTRTILTFILFIALGWVCYSVFSVVLYLFTSVLIALGLEPMVEFLIKKKIRRGLAVLIVFSAFISFIFSIFYFALSPMVAQTQNLIFKFPAFLESLGKYQVFNGISTSFNNSLFSQLQLSSKSILNVTLGAFSGLISLFSILVFTIYLLLDFKNVREFILNVLPQKSQSKASKVIKKVETRLGAWIRGELILMTIVGLFTFIGLTIIGMEYTLSLSLIAGFLELIPTLGPLISAVPATIVGFAISPTMGLLVIAVYIIVQQVENNLFVPKVMQKAVGFNPLVTLIAVLVGGKLFGFMGMLFAVPVVLILQTLIESFSE
ncbi:AI-2E family transporter [Candidatus Parcubacteria bacterium]|nr:AI-2E family transporter [Patescibacteria group bacterium]MCG2689536.1 AI-2E family transporter [Candidatus Parcubacteria bacterium]